MHTSSARWLAQPGRALACTAVARRRRSTTPHCQIPLSACLSPARSSCQARKPAGHGKAAMGPARSSAFQGLACQWHRRSFTPELLVLRSTHRLHQGEAQSWQNRKRRDSPRIKEHKTCDVEQAKGWLVLLEMTGVPAADEKLSGRREHQPSAAPGLDSSRRS